MKTIQTQPTARILLAVTMVLLLTPPGWGEEAATEELPNRFMVRGGYGLVFNADTIVRFNGAGGIGSTVDFARTLGGERSDSFWRIDSQYRFNDRHSLGFSYYDVTRNGNRVLNENVTIGDTTYAAGGALQSELDIKLYRLIYNYSFYHSDKVELGLSGGLYLANLKTLFAGNLICSGGPSCGGGTTIASRTESDKLTVPLPSFGLLVNYNITTRLQAQVRFDWFYLETDSFKGSMNEFYAGLEYRLFKNFGIGGAFDRLAIDVDYKPEKESGWGVRNTWATAFFYGALYF